MRVRSLHKFYQVHFGRDTSASPAQRKAFARAVGDCVRVLHEVSESRSRQPITDYESSSSCRELTIGFLRNAECLATRRYDDVGRVDFVDHKIEVNPGFLTLGRKREMIIHSPILWNVSLGEAVFLNFGPSTHMIHEIAVFRTLCEQLDIRACPPTSSAKLYVYWDLRAGTEEFVQRDATSPAELDLVVSTCNRILSQAGYR